MLLRLWKKALLRMFGGRAARQPARRSCLPGIEPLGERILPAVTASFLPGPGIVRSYAARLPPLGAS